MSLTRAIEADVCKANTGPGEALRDGGEILEPGEDKVGAGAQTHEGEEGDGGGNGDAVVGNTRLGALEEEARGLAELGNTEEVTGAGVQEGITGRGGGGQDDGVDDVREHGDTRVLAGDDPGRLARTGEAVVGERGVAGTDAHTDDEGAENVEEEDTPEHTADGLGDVLARVGGLTSSDGDHLGTTVGESGVDKGGPQTGEATSISLADVLFHGAFLPVTESTAVMVRSTAEPDDYTAEQQTEDGDNFYRRKAEFGLSVYRYSEDVQTDDDDDDDGDPNTLIDLFLGVPETDDDGGGRDFGTESDGALIPWLVSLRCCQFDRVTHSCSIQQRNQEQGRRNGRSTEE